MKKRALHFIALATAFFAMSASFLVNANLKRHYKPGDFVPEENAYFVEEIDDPAGLVKAHKFIMPSDNKYTTQKNYSHSIIGDIENTWSAYTGKGTTVAIIDDGFDYNHPEYTRVDGTHAILSTSRYYYSSGGNAYYKEYSSEPTCIAEDWEETYEGSGKYEWATHGTNTSTTAAAPMGNGGGVGIAPEADILALKIDFSFVAIRAAIQYAIDQKVDVINMSLGAYAESFTDGWGDQQSGSSSTSTYLNTVCNNAYKANIIVVAAAGNESTWHKSYPACNTKVIGVGALEENDANTLAAFTNYVGTSQTGEINVDILAPGYVYTATQAGTQSKVTHTYSDTQGTSFSSPIVAGAACLWKEKYPNGTPSEFLTQLQSSAAGIGTYKNKMVPVSLWGSSYSDVGPSNIECGRLDVGALLDISEPSVTTVQSNVNIAVNETKQIDIASSNGTISYTSANTNVATVSDSGLIRGVGTGTTTVTVTATKNNKTATATVSVRVESAVAATSIAFSPTTKSMNVGDTFNCEPTITVQPSNASRIFLFESEDESVATVDIDTGLITAVGVGATSINVIAGYGTGDATLTVTVSQASTVDRSGTINFGNGTGEVNVNSGSITGNDSRGNSWDITTTGTTSFTPSSGKAQIGSKNNPATRIDFEMSLSSSVTFKSVEAKFGGNKDSSGTVTIKVGSTTVGSGTITSSSDVVVTNNTVSSASGTTLSISITNISKGINAYYISYTYSESGGSSSAVGVTGVSLSPTELSLKTGGSSQLTATVAPSTATNKNVSWSSSHTNVATVSSSGLVSAVAAGDATITVTTVDGGKTATCYVVVSDNVVSVTGISLSTNSISLSVGGTQTLTATVTPSNASDKTVYWSSSNTDVASVSDGGVVSAITPGNATITARTNNGGYTATCSVTVTASGGAGGSDSFIANYNYDNKGTTWTLTNCSDGSTYWRCPENSSTSVALFSGIFEDKTIVSDVVVRIDHATYGSGTDPSSSTFKIFNASDCNEQVAASQTGALATSSTYKTAIYTITSSNANSSFTDDLAIQIYKPGKQIRLRSVSIEFDYTDDTSKTLTSISVETAPTKTVYQSGEYFDPTGLVITRHYSDSTSSSFAYAGHTEDFSFNPALNVALTSSNTSVTITYREQSASQNITVNPALTSITLTGQTTSYEVQDTFTFTGTCTAHYEDGSSKTVTPTSVTSPDMSSAGQKTITVTYTETGISHIAQYTITVNAWVLQSIAVSTMPTKTTYYQNEVFSSAGLVITATYTNGKTKAVTPTSVSTPSTATTGNKTVTVTYTEGNVTKQTTFNIAVNAIVLSFITLSGQTTYFHVGDTFSFGGTVTAHYNNGSSGDVTSSTTFTGYNMSQAGEQTVTATYNGQSQTYSITVMEQGQGNPVIHIDTEGETTYTVHTGDLVEGDYVIAYEDHAMNNTVTSNRLQYDTITYSNGQITSNVGATIEWHISKTGDYWQIQSLAEDKYAASTGTKSQAGMNSDATSNKTKWSVTVVNNNTYNFVNKYNSDNSVNATLRSNGTSGFACYASNFSSSGPLTLYKKETTAGSSQDVTVTSLTVTSSVTTYHPGENFDKTKLTVIGNYDGGSATLDLNECVISPANYMFTYDDARTGSKSIAVSWEGVTTSVTLSVTRIAYVPISGETQSLTGSEFYTAGVTNGTGSNELQDFPNLVIGDIHYSADNVGIYTDTSTSKKYISFGKGIGELHNTTPFNKPLTSVTLQQMSGRRTDGVVYVSTDGTNWVSESSANFSSTNYYYLKIAYESASSASGAAGYSNFTIDYSLHGVETPTNVANYIMYEDTNNQCTSKFENAIIYFESLGAEGRTTFMTSNDYVISTARERFLAWAKHEGKTINYVNNDYVVSQSKGVLPILLNSKASQNAALITVITLVSFTALGGYFFLRKRKEQ